MEHYHLCTEEDRKMRSKGKKRARRAPWYERIPADDMWPQYKVRFARSTLETIARLQQREEGEKGLHAWSLSGVVRHLVTLGLKALEEREPDPTVAAQDAFGRVDLERERWRHRPSHPCYYAVYTAEGWFCGREVPGASVDPGVAQARWELGIGHVLVTAEGEKVTDVREVMR
jgi:hypothetical protein